MTEPQVNPTSSVATPRMALCVAAGAVFGFAVGFFLGWLGLWSPAMFGALGMCLGALAGAS